MLKKSFIPTLLSLFLISPLSPCYGSTAEQVDNALQQFLRSGSYQDLEDAVQLKAKLRAYQESQISKKLISKSMENICARSPNHICLNELYSTPAFAYPWHTSLQFFMHFKPVLNQSQIKILSTLCTLHAMKASKHEAVQLSQLEEHYKFEYSRKSYDDMLLSLSYADYALSPLCGARLCVKETFYHSTVRNAALIFGLIAIEYFI